jgi:proteasome lid subunit RPN8/RPN11
MPPTWARLLLPRTLYDAMLAHALAELPFECCGLFGGTISEDGASVVVERYPLANIADSPTIEYLSEPAGMFAAWRDMRRRGLEVLAVYHSHPTSAPVPSRKDLAHSYGPEVVNLIISLTTSPPAVSGWRFTFEDYREAEWSVVDD